VPVIAQAVAMSHHCNSRTGLSYGIAANIRWHALPRSLSLLRPPTGLRNGTEALSDRKPCPLR